MASALETLRQVSLENERLRVDLAAAHYAIERLEEAHKTLDRHFLDLLHVIASDDSDPEPLCTQLAKRVTVLEKELEATRAIVGGGWS